MRDVLDSCDYRHCSAGQLLARSVTGSECRIKSREILGYRACKLVAVMEAVEDCCG